MPESPSTVIDKINKIGNDNLCSLTFKKFYNVIIRKRHIFHEYLTDDKQFRWTHDSTHL